MSPSSWITRAVGPLGLLLLVVIFFWKLTLTNEFAWFDHPDMCAIEIPRLQFQARELHLGHFPLWDPSIWAGQSLIGQTQPGPLFPLTLLFLLLPLDHGYLQSAYLNGYWVVLHALAALACYALCRDWGRSRTGAILAAIGFGCGGFLGTVAWLDVAAGAIFTPLVLLFLARSLEGRRPYSRAACSGLFLGLAWLSGHHEIPLLVSLLFIAIWAVAVWVRKSAVPLACVALVITGQVLPTIEFGRLSQRWVGTTEPVGWDDKIPYTIATVYSLPAHGLLYTFLPNADRYADCAPFLGLAIVALAIVGLSTIGQTPRVRWIALATAVSLLFALGAATPFHGALYSLLPGLGKARMPVRALHTFNLGLCLLAAYGWDELRARPFPPLLQRGLLLVGLLITGWAIGNPALDDRLLLSGFLALALAASLSAKLTPTALAALWVTVSLTELHGVSTATYSSRYRDDQFRFVKRLAENKDIADFLRAAERQSPVRIAVKEEDVPINYGDYHGVDALQGYVAGVPRNLLRAELHTDRSQSLLAVTHYLGKEPARTGQVSMYEGKSGVKVFANPDAMPRVWSVHEIIRASTGPDLRDRVQVQPIDFHRQAVLLGDAPTLELCDGDEVKLNSRNPDRVRLTATMRCTGMVILADSYYPGWQATVDGRSAPIWEAYGAIRGVVVPAGDHQVEFRFRPGSVYLGAGLFLLGLLATGVLVLRRR